MAETGTILIMSQKERASLLVLERVKQNECTLKEGSELLGISYRQCCRRYKRYRERGAEGLVHRLRGRSSNRALAVETAEEITRLYGDIYEGFGPVLYAEKLESEHGIKADHETVRRLLIRKGLWQAKKKKQKKHAPWRERRAHFGEMVQIDGSHHRWFGAKGEQCCLMVMIDDATGIRMSLMAKGETTKAAMQLMWKWVKKYGVPRSLYADKKNVYLPSEKDLEKARIQGKKLYTQFGRACSRLGVEIIPAHSPQGKGRVERANGVYQDRFVKELRLRGITDIEAANELIGGGWFDEDINGRFAVEPRKKADYHRTPPGDDLSFVFCIEEERTLTANWTLSFKSGVYRIKPETEHYSPAKTKVQVKKFMNDSLHIYYRGREVEYEKFDPPKRKAVRNPVNSSKPKTSKVQKTSKKDHPWRKLVITPPDKTRPFY